MLYQVMVGNIGCVYHGNDESYAHATYAAYVKQSTSNYGRAANESVILMQKDLLCWTVLREYFPLCASE